MITNKFIIDNIGYDFHKENIDYLVKLDGRRRSKIFYILPNYSLLEKARLDLLDRLGGIQAGNIMTFDDLANRYSKKYKAFIDRNVGSWIIKKIVENLNEVGFSTSLATSKEILSFILMLKSNGVDCKSFIEVCKNYKDMEIFSLIYTKYEEILLENNIEDEIGKYYSAKGNILNGESLEGFEIIINGFIEFRPHELELMRALKEKSAYITIQYPFKLERSNKKLDKTIMEVSELGFKIEVNNNPKSEYGELAYDFLSNSKEIYNFKTLEIAASNTYYEMREVFISIKKDLEAISLSDISIIADQEYESLIKRISKEMSMPISIMNEEDAKNLPLIASVINFLDFIFSDEKGKLISILHDSNFDMGFHDNKSHLIRELRVLNYRGLFYNYENLDSGLEEFINEIRKLSNDIVSNPKEELLNFIDEDKLRVKLIDSYNQHGDINTLRESLMALDLLLNSIKEVSKISDLLKLEGNEYLEILLNKLMESKYYIKNDTIGVQVLRPINSIGISCKKRYICGLSSNVPAFPNRGYFYGKKFDKFYEELGIRKESMEEIYDNEILTFAQNLAGSEEVVFSYSYSNSSLENDKSFFLKDILKRINPDYFKSFKARSLIKTEVGKFDGIRDRVLSDIVNRRNCEEISLNYLLKSDIDYLNRKYENYLERFDGKDEYWGKVEGSFSNIRYFVNRFVAFNSCPFKYYLKFVLDYKSLELDYVDEFDIDRGNLYHEVLKDLYKDYDVFTISDDELERLIYDLVYNQIERIDKYQGNKEGQIEIFKTYLLDFVMADIEEHNKIKSEFKPRHFEKEYTKDMGSFRISGKIDRVDVDKDGNLIVLDYKTNYAPNGAEVKRLDDIQLALYSYILNSERVVAGYYAIIQKAQMIKGFFHEEFAPTKRDVYSHEEMVNYNNRIEDLIFEMDEKIKSGDFLVKPRRDKECDYCEYIDICRKEEAGFNEI